MNKNQPQSFENHSRLIPLWHYVTAGVILLLTIHALYHVVVDFTPAAIVELVFCLVLVSIWVFARVFALTAQDRIIRLEAGRVVPS